MPRRHHWTLLLVGVLAWLFFFLAGLESSYYTAWSSAEKVLLCFVTFFAAVPLVGGLVLVFMGGDHVRTSLWLAFYVSVPLLLLDCVVVGWVQGAGPRFLVSHWYVTIGYFYVWLELPVIGLALRKLRSGANP